MKRTIEIDDTLPEILDAAKDDLREALFNWLDENCGDMPDEAPCLHNDIDYDGTFHEICDSAVPVYTGGQKDLWYLYGDEFEQAFDDQGFEREGEWPMGWQAAAIYCYIQQELSEWYDENAMVLCKEWAKERIKDEN